MTSSEGTPVPACRDATAIKEQLAVTASRLSAQSAAVNRQLAQAHDAAANADRRVEMADDAFRSSSDGLAESLRAIERAAMSKQPTTVLRQLQQLHVAAEDASAREYRQRRDAWGHTTGDGPLRACPLGTDPALAVLALRDQIMATYRSDPAATTVRVQILQLADDGRRRMAVHLDATADLTVCGVLRTITADAGLSRRMSRNLAVEAEEYVNAAGTGVLKASPSAGQ